MSPEPRPATAAPVRRPYEPPAIKFEKRIEAFAVACTCTDLTKTGGAITTFIQDPPGPTCGADNYS